MTGNVKVDIIYYTVGTDFELEFNLCGCCRMRMLTDKVSNQKDYVLSLKRSVDRSKVIISCGPLFGDKGLIETVATATGIGTEMIDSSKYELDIGEEFAILKGSIPLISSEGVFGGCIIENGPQTIILLTENKSSRKRIMTELIHPYISSIGATLNEDTEDYGTMNVETSESFAEVLKEKESEEAVPEPSAQAEEKPNEEPAGESAEEPDEEPDDIKASEDNTDKKISVNDEFILETEEETEKVKDEEFEIDNGMILDDMIIDNDSDDNRYRSVEEQNNKYYIDYEDDEIYGGQSKKLELSIKIICVLLVLLLAAIAVFVVLRSASEDVGILTYLRDALTPKTNQYVSIILP